MKKIMALVAATVLAVGATGCTYLQKVDEYKAKVSEEVEKTATQEETIAETAADTTAEDTAVPSDFDEFLLDFSLIEGSLCDDEKNIDFLDDAQRENYLRALSFEREQCFGMGPTLANEKGYYNQDDGYWHSGNDYESFKNYLLGIFNEEFVTETLSTELFKNIDGELCIMDGGKGCITYIGGSYALVSSDDNKVVFTYTANYSWAEVMSKEEWDAEEHSVDDLYEWTVERTITMNKGEDGIWRTDYFELWY